MFVSEKLTDKSGDKLFKVKSWRGQRNDKARIADRTIRAYA
jgi:hypothetical protein